MRASRKAKVEFSASRAEPLGKAKPDLSSSVESCVLLLSYQVLKASGGDALWGNTRTHPEHDG